MHLNEHEMWRDLVRRSTGEVVDAYGLLLVAGPIRPLRVAMRTAPRVPASEALERATSFFAGRGGGFTLVVSEPDDDDLAELASEAGFRRGWREVAMALGEPVAVREPGGVTIRPVETELHVQHYGSVVVEANDPPESDRAEVVFSRPESILAPHIAGFVAYLDEEPVSTAMTLVSHGVAGVFWVATVERARRRGLGSALTRRAANAGFDRGARAAWLGSSEMGSGLYRRIGFSETGWRYQEYESR
jgi:ribosomal protein S18 acetylase RimI-like enzyme